MSPLAKELFNLLQSGELYSGEALAQRFNVTRQAVWKAINELKTGHLVETIGRQGYKAFYPYIPLDRQSILAQLPNNCVDDVITHIDITSTNEEIAKLPLTKALVMVSEMQTQGRGRNGKVWVSPLARNLYFSMRIQFKAQALANLTSFSPALGIYLVEYLQSKNIPAKIKWPNDIWVNGAKLAGILIETSAKSEHEVEMIIGIGLNNLPLIETNLTQNRATSIYEILGEAFNRNILVADIIQLISNLRDDYESFNLPNIVELWNQNSALHGQKVKLFSPAREIIGTEVGIADNGALLIQQENGTVQQYFSGELSLRAYA
ncbi:biotin--[acetyl-CoA-carboxylase] ligase [Wohlfahrtiimonas larvae]|uniref:biotin--[biotin carboxyl-carrier protein] ligase n=1 Tax=Wohlfahrtiimonas larvae TaxID=1157986 RepID=A0ABP9MVK3_9GAMM|nr:biotin--[acetyl-CoA-carboxylase] ligase [Wohlfahrtiimonas larvae]